MLKRIKQPVLRTLKGLGFHSEWNNSRWRRARLAILCYHGTALEDENEWNPELYMDVGRLEERLKMLRNGGYNVLPLDDAIRRLYEKTLPPRSVALTFDDGGYDFYRRAYPLLKKYNFPATVYLSTYYCYRSIPIFPLTCYYLLWKARDGYYGDELVDWGCPVGLDLNTVPGVQSAMNAIVAHASKLGSKERDALVEQLARRLGQDYEVLLSKRLFQLMKPEEVTRLAADGVDIQLHTHRHRVPMDHDLFVREIEENRRCVLEMTGVEPVHFCYPGGVYDQAFLPWLREQRVVSATTCEAGLACPQDHPLLLPRIVDTGAMSPIEFESALAGISAALVRGRGKRQAVRSS
jgi:peptidoglycan/xylan/chitin deacetylase (PgdA/CDA1 family)